MVRRWSHINNLNNLFFKYKTNKFYTSLILFKTSVNFKRYTYKFTKFKRKSFYRLKHKTNFLIYSQIIKYWTTDYMIAKVSIKGQVFNKIFLNNYYIHAYNFLKKKNNKEVFKNFAILTIFASKTLKPLDSAIKDVTNHIGSFYNRDCLNTINTLTFVKPLYIIADNTLFPVTISNNKEIFDTIKLNELHFLFFKQTVKQVSLLRRILSLLIYNSIKNVNLIC